jgi:hypothetical protein
MTVSSPSGCNSGVAQGVFGRYFMVKDTKGRSVPSVPSGERSLPSPRAERCCRIMGGRRGPHRARWSAAFSFIPQTAIDALTKVHRSGETPPTGYISLCLAPMSSRSSATQSPEWQYATGLAEATRDELRTCDPYRPSATACVRYVQQEPPISNLTVS